MDGPSFRVLIVFFLFLRGLILHDFVLYETRSDRNKMITVAGCLMVVRRKIWKCFVLYRSGEEETPTEMAGLHYAGGGVWWRQQGPNPAKLV